MSSKEVKLVTKVTQPQRFNTLRKPDTLLQGFWLFVFVLVIWAIFNVQTSSIASIMGAALIAFAALLPSYLWCSRKVIGIPVFPLFALTYLWTYAIQLVTAHPIVVNYSPESQLFAGVTVAGFLGIGTSIWLQFVKSTPRPPKSYRAFSSKASEPFFLFSLVASIFFSMSILGGWFKFDGGLFAVIRAIVLAVTALAIFVLSYNFGTQKLSKNTSRLFLFLLFIYIITNTVTILLVGAISAFLLSTIAFIWGRRQVPWLLIVVVLVCFALLHPGKGEMRSRYWASESNQVHFVQPWEYPSFYAEWINYSLKSLNAPIEQEDEDQSALERVSLIHLLLMAQERTPRDVPYLSGATYEFIPQLLVPRFLNSNKIRSHEGTYLLNIHYGLQTRADTDKTVIGWGLLNEAYANFGLLGCLGLAVVLGAGYGQATRWSLNTPLLSSRSLFSILLISFAFQSEFSAGVYVAALFQSAAPLVAVSFLFMSVYRTK